MLLGELAGEEMRNGEIKDVFQCISYPTRQVRAQR